MTGRDVVRHVFEPVKINRFSGVKIRNSWVKWGNGRLNDRHETHDFGRVSSRNRENLFRWDFEMAVAVASTSEHFSFNSPSNVKPWSLTFKFLNIGRRDGVKYGNSMK